MKKLFYALSITLLFASCGENTEEKINAISQEKRDLVIQQFQTKMVELCQNSNEVLDKGITALDNGTSADSIDASIIEIVKANEEAIEKLSKSFKVEMKVHGIKKADMQATHKSLTECFNALQEKHKKLKEAGVKLN